MNSNPSGRLEETAAPYGMVGLPTADATDPVLEAIKRDLDLSLVEENLKLTTDERAANLVNVTRFIAKFRPIVAEQTQARRE